MSLPSPYLKICTGLQADAAHPPLRQCTTFINKNFYMLYIVIYIYFPLPPGIVKKSFSAQQGAAPTPQFPMGVFSEKSPGNVAYINILGSFRLHLPRRQLFIQRLLTENKPLDFLICVIFLVGWTHATTWRYSDILIETVELKVLMAFCCGRYLWCGLFAFGSVITHWSIY